MNKASVKLTSWGIFLCIRRDKHGALSGSLREAFKHIMVIALQASCGTSASFALYPPTVI